MEEDVYHTEYTSIIYNNIAARKADPR